MTLRLIKYSSNVYFVRFSKMGRKRIIFWVGYWLGGGWTNTFQTEKEDILATLAEKMGTGITDSEYFHSIIRISICCNLVVSTCANHSFQLGPESFLSSPVLDLCPQTKVLWNQSSELASERDFHL